MAGLDPAIHDGFPRRKLFVSIPDWGVIMDARVKPAHDIECGVWLQITNSARARRFASGLWSSASFGFRDAMRATTIVLAAR